MSSWKFWQKKEHKPVSRPQQRAYAGAMLGRLVNDWMATSTSIDSEIRGSLKALRNRSRQLGRDNDYAKSAFREIVNNVVGQGIPFQSQVRMQRGGKLDERVNDLIETQWEKWKHKRRCHTEGKLFFADIERLAMRSVAESGEVIIRLIKQPFGDSKVPLALEIIESDLLDDDLNGLAENGNEIRMGVEVDQWYRPTAYYFLQKHPGDYQLVYGVTRQTKHIRIPADEIIHLFITERAKQSRGVPWLASTIMRLHHMHGYEEAEVINARATASLMGFIESEDGELIGDDVQDYDQVYDFEPGVFKKLAPGQKVSIPDMHRAPGQLDPFMKIMLRGAAAGTGVSYASLSKDYSDSNYSSSRLALLSDRDNWKVLQSWLILNLHQEIFEKWLDMATLAGVVSLPNYELVPEKYQAVRWMPRGWAWIDPTKEVAAYKEAVKAGFTTQTEVIAQGGSDVEEMFMQRKREVDLAKSHGLIFDTDPENDKKAQEAKVAKQEDDNEDKLDKAISALNREIKVEVKPEIIVKPAQAPNVNVNVEKNGAVKKTVERDEKGLIVAINEVPEC